MCFFQYLFPSQERTIRAWRKGELNEKIHARQLILKNIDALA